MVLNHLVGSRRTGSRAPRGRRAGRPPTLEALEDRCLLSANLVRDINPGAPGSQPASLVSVGGAVFFLATDPAHGRELYKSDGTEQGTVLVKDITPGPDDTRAQLLGAVNGRLVFLVNPVREAVGGSGDLEVLGTSGGRGLLPGPITLSFANIWVSDGTEEGTAPIATLPIPVTPYTILGLASPTEVNGALYFQIVHGERDPLGMPTIVSSNSLWRTDGTRSGTRSVASAGELGEMENVNGTLFMTAYVRAGTGLELYKLNAAGNGIELVKDVRPGSFSSFPSRLTDLNGTLYFTATDGARGNELWRSDGTEEGTVLVKDVRPGAFGSSPSDLRVVGDTLFFTADDGDGGRELWASDGTEDGTVLVRDIRPGPGSANPGELTAVGDMLFFTADDGEGGRELWKSDGTEDGTRLVRDINPGAAGSGPRELRAAGGALFFTADDGVSGRELWVVAPAGVADVALDDSSAQRSRVASVTVTFSGAVTLEDGAFELLRPGGELVPLSVATSEVDGRTVAAITFLGDDVLGGSLPDGDYTLTVRGDRVRDALGRALDGDGDGAAGGDRSVDFFRLYGDADGDRLVGDTDRALFDSTFGLTAEDAGFLWYFDYDGDGLIGATDLDAFLSRFSG